jgi:hypothetical protein
LAVRSFGDMNFSECCGITPSHWHAWGFSYLLPEHCRWHATSSVFLGVHGLLVGGSLTIGNSGFSPGMSFLQINFSCLFTLPACYPFKCALLPSTPIPISQTYYPGELKEVTM